MLSTLVLTSVFQVIISMQIRSLMADLGFIHKVTLVVLGLFVFSMAWGESIDVTASKLTLTALLGMLSFAMTIALVVDRGIPRPVPVFYFLLFVFAAWILLSTIWSPVMDYGKSVAYQMLQLMLMAFMVRIVLTRESHVTAIYQLYVWGVIYASYLVIFGGSDDSFGYQRAGIANTENNHIAIMMAMSIPIAAYVNTQIQSAWLKLINIVSIPIAFYAIFLIATRTATVVGVIGVLYWLFTYRKAPIGYRIIGLVMIAVGLSVAIKNAPQSSIDRIATTGQSISSGTLNDRTVIWKYAIKEWKKSPFIGQGIGSFQYVMNKHKSFYSAAHNTYLHLLTEVGLIGFSLFLFIWLVLFYYIAHMPSEQRWFMLALSAELLIAQLTIHWHDNKTAWMLMGLMATQFSIVQLRQFNNRMIKHEYSYT